MPSVARLTDIWTGVCECHDEPQDVIGIIVTCSPTGFSENLGPARVGDMVIAFCDEHHSGIIVAGSTTYLTDSIETARVGDPVTGCTVGIITTGDPTHMACENGGKAGPTALVPFKDRIILFTEVDFGNLDDDEEVDDGLNVYPPVPSGGAPTPEQISKSKALEVAPQSTVTEDAASAPPESTPPTACIDVPEPPPANFPLSPNFTLGSLTIQTALSRTAVKAQHGLTVPDMVCNLQAWAQNVGEALAAQYGRSNMLITSGFRAGSSTSQHERGQACDVQFPGKSNNDLFAIAQWVRANIPFDQFIYEYGGNKPWFHLSFNRAGNRPTSASNKWGTRTSAGSYVWGKLLERA
jgi:uncharacterized Zn-binding protein involved in type VI secretion